VEKLSKCDTLYYYDATCDIDIPVVDAPVSNSERGPIRIGLFAGGRSRSQMTARLIGACAEREVECVIAVWGRAERPAAPVLDVAVAEVHPSDLDPLSAALETLGAAGNPEVVLVCHDAGQGAARALLSLGLRHLVPAAAAVAWIADAAPTLARRARARRALELADGQALPPIPGGLQLPDLARGLFEEELCFRETYVRALLAQTQSRSEAARRARVPYRTFCQILSKLGIAGGAPPTAVPVGRRAASSPPPRLEAPLAGHRAR
jgi:hypothetical protein